jgi:hypothetical protein
MCWTESGAALFIYRATATSQAAPRTEPMMPSSNLLMAPSVTGVAEGMPEATLVPFIAPGLPPTEVEVEVAVGMQVEVVTTVGVGRLPPLLEATQEQTAAASAATEGTRLAGQAVLRQLGKMVASDDCMFVLQWQEKSSMAQPTTDIADTRQGSAQCSMDAAYLEQLS